MPFCSRQTAHAFVLLCLILGMVACSSNPASVPITDVNERAPIERTTSTTTQATRDTTSATATLVASAASARAANDPASAIAYLERAIRLAPREAELWISLSAAHLEDDNLIAAEQHARKAIALSSSEPGLERQAWRQFAHVLSAQGKTAQANSILRRYQNLEG